MKVKTFQARSMREALALVKRTFGSGAVIIHTRTLRAPGLNGLFGRQIVEVAAASEVARQQRPQSQPARKRDLSEAYLRQEPPKQQLPNDQIARLREEISGIRSSLDDLVRSNCPLSIAGLPEKLTEGYLTLVRNGVTDQLAAEVIRSLAEEMTDAELQFADKVRQGITERLGEYVRVSGPVRLDAHGRRVAALIGPTGVGKTTTIAKLAANFKVRGRRRVALITIDTYRIAAVQQLQTIADIIRVPLRTVLTVGDLKQALEELREYDLVLIDTAGRSQRDELKMNDLKCFLEAAKPDEVHLVVSATASMENMLEVVERFRGAGPNRMVLTKVDEAEALGRLVSVSRRSDLPISYVTTGQDIPNDIEVASASRVVAMAWER